MPVTPMPGLLIDVMTLRGFNEYGMQADVAFPKSLNDRQFQARVVRASTDPEGQLFLDVIENVVLWDVLRYDPYALRASETRIAEAVFDVFDALAITPSQYKRVSDEVERRLRLYSSTLYNDERLSVSRLEYQHDLYEKFGLLDPSPEYASTNNKAARALFYLETAREFGLPAYLTAGKRKWLDAFNEQIPSDSGHGRVVEVVRQELPELAAMPIAELVLRHARAKGVTVCEAAMEIRNSAEARSYRSLLGQLSRLCLQGGLGNALQANKLLLEIKAVATDWKKQSDTRAGVEYKARTLRLGWLGKLVTAVPTVPLSETAAAVLEAMPDITIHDPILNRRDYLVFMSRW